VNFTYSKMSLVQSFDPFYPVNPMEATSFWDPFTQQQQQQALAQRNMSGGGIGSGGLVAPLYGGRQMFSGSGGIGLQHTSCGPCINMDFVETDNSYVIHCDMPGYNKDDINLTVDSGVLNIHATKKDLCTNLPANCTYYRRERSWGKVHRSIRLPSDVDTTGANLICDYTNGVLCITFPKLTSSTTMKKLIVQCGTGNIGTGSCGTSSSSSSNQQQQTGTKGNKY